MIFDEPGLEDLALLVPCFQIERRGIRFAAFTILPIEAVGVAKWRALVQEERQMENQTVLL